MDEHALRDLDAAMVRLADGERSACSVVFSILWTELVAFAERAVGKGPDADDAAQQALEKIFDQAAEYDPKRSALAWALAIAAWECRTTLQRRKRRREESIEHADAAPSSTLDPEEAAVQGSMLAALRASLAELSPRDQETLEEAFLRETEGPRAPAFRKRKERALSRLRSTWRRIHGA